MLTFQFSGVDGSMTESEILTSGMVGKQVQLLFDDSWANLNKTLVFRAGETTRVVTDPAFPATIPSEVLARPFGKLYVGVYGTDENDTLVIPTIMAEGPVIRYGADPIEDETAKELPVWENLQNQIGDLSLLETKNQENLVSALNDLAEKEETLTTNLDNLAQAQTFMGSSADLQTGAKATLVDAVNELHIHRTGLEAQVQVLAETQTHMGDTTTLETTHKHTLVGAVNEVHRQVAGLLEQAPLTLDAAQLLVDILSKGIYFADQRENIDALAELFGVTVTEDLSHLLLYWDFRTGSLTDLLAGLEATGSQDVTLDASGAQLETANSYLMFPAGPDNTLAGLTAEIKFGPMSLNQTATTMRLLCISTGSQPVSSGLQWTAKDCWSRAASVVTEFKDIDMFSGKRLLVKGSADGSQVDFYCEDQLIISLTPSFNFSHLSIGSTSSAAFPLTVEYVRIYPTV